MNRMDIFRCVTEQDQRHVLYMVDIDTSAIKQKNKIVKAFIIGYDMIWNLENGGEVIQFICGIC